MKKLILTATIFIAIYSISTRASAEEVYRCGSNYSQKPCPNAVVVDVQDSRTPEQKAEADAKTRHETAQVKVLEMARQKEEAQRRAENAKLAAAKPRATAASAPALKSATSSAGKRRKKTVKIKNEPEFFAASAPNGKPKVTKKAGK